MASPYRARLEACVCQAHAMTDSSLSSSRNEAPSNRASDEANVDFPDPELPTTDTRRTAAEPNNPKSACHLDFRPAMMGR